MTALPDGLSPEIAEQAERILGLAGTVSARDIAIALYLIFKGYAVAPITKDGKTVFLTA